MAQVEFKENQTHRKSFERLCLYLAIGGIVVTLLAVQFVG